MKAKDVEVGRTYIVKVSGKLQPVQVIQAHASGKGYVGMNRRTGRKIRIHSAARLRRPAAPDCVVYAAVADGVAKDLEQKGSDNGDENGVRRLRYRS